MYRGIMVALDESELSEQALPHARVLAKALGARITLFSVAEPTSIGSQPGMIGPVISISMDIKEDVEHEKAYLEEVAEPLRAEGLEVDTEVSIGDPAARICEYAEKHPQDLIVMTTHGRSGVKRLVYGSVAEKVLHCAGVPILLVRAKHE